MLKKIVIIKFLCLAFLAAAFGQRDNTLISEKSIDGNFVGGLKDALPFATPTYTSSRKIIGEPKINNVDDLLKALKSAKKGDVLYLDDNVTFDLTGCHSLTIPEGVSLTSGRGTKGSRGALLFTRLLDTRPLFVTGGDNVVIFGVRIQGPDSMIVNNKELKKSKTTMNRQNSRFNVYGIPNSQGILIKHKNVVVENCEIYAWSYAGIAIDGGSASINHNYIHHNQRTGLGYGVSLLKSGYALIKGNLFDYNRHAIASTGSPGTSYTACYNICLENSALQAHVFDVHGGKDRNDNSNIAGDSVNIHDNIFYLPEGKIAFRIRGVPRYISQIYDNQIILSKKMGKVAASRGVSSLASKNTNISSYINQVYGSGNLKIYNNKISNK